MQPEMWREMQGGGVCWAKMELKQRDKELEMQFILEIELMAIFYAHSKFVKLWPDGSFGQLIVKY